MSGKLAADPSLQGLSAQLQAVLARLQALEDTVATVDNEKYELAQRVQILEHKAGIGRNRR
jgi:hypothetical protein